MVVSRTEGGRTREADEQTSRQGKEGCKGRRGLTYVRKEGCKEGMLDRQKSSRELLVGRAAVGGAESSRGVWREWEWV